MAAGYLLVSVRNQPSKVIRTVLFPSCPSSSPSVLAGLGQDMRMDGSILHEPFIPWRRWAS